MRCQCARARVCLRRFPFVSTGAARHELWSYSLVILILYALCCD
jgi:hypothetical protein